MARPGRPERNRAARSFRQLRRFHHGINSNKVFGTHTGALHRIISAQAVQFPELAKLANEEGWLRAVRGVSSILRQSAAGGQIKIDHPELAADMFLNLVLGHAKRLALYGIATDPQTEERYRKAAVDFFLSGIRTE
jgi:TetR/AcrR family transcriptional regulator, mexJK operon transcriptional repressor